MGVVFWGSIFFFFGFFFLGVVFWGSIFWGLFFGVVFGTLYPKLCTLYPKKIRTLYPVPCTPYPVFFRGSLEYPVPHKPKGCIFLGYGVVSGTPKETTGYQQKDKTGTPKETTGYQQIRGILAIGVPTTSKRYYPFTKTNNPQKDKTLFSQRQKVFFFWGTDKISQRQKVLSFCW